MANALISQPVLSANPGDIRQIQRIKALVKDMRPKFDTIRSVTVHAIPVESNAVNDLYGDWLELSHLVRNHPLFAE
jgi:hypothetical protein